MDIFPEIRRENEASWVQALMGWSWMTQHSVLLIVANFVCVVGFIDLGMFALRHGINLALVVGTLGMLLSIPALAGYYFARLVQRTRALLAQDVLVAQAESEVLRISYLGYRLYFCALMGMGVVAMVVPGFFKF